MTKKKIKQLSIKPIVRKVISIMLTIPVVLLVCVFIFTGVLMAYSPGKPEPFLDENGKQIPAVFQKRSLSISTVFSKE